MSVNLPVRKVVRELKCLGGKQVTRVYLLHCRRKGIVPTLIRLFTRSRTTHTAILIDNEDQFFVLEAQSNGVVIRSFRAWCSRFEYNFSITCIGSQIDENQLISMTASKYNFGALLIFKPINIIFGRYLRRKSPMTASRFSCSQLAGYIAGLDDYYKITPADLEKVFPPQTSIFSGAYYSRYERLLDAEI